MTKKGPQLSYEAFSCSCLHCWSRAAEERERGGLAGDGYSPNIVRFRAPSSLGRCRFRRRPTVLLEPPPPLGRRSAFVSLSLWSPGSGQAAAAGAAARRGRSRGPRPGRSGSLRRPVAPASTRARPARCPPRLARGAAPEKGVGPAPALSTRTERTKRRRGESSGLLRKTSWTASLPSRTPPCTSSVSSIW